MNIIIRILLIFIGAIFSWGAADIGFRIGSLLFTTLLWSKVAGAIIGVIALALPLILLHLCIK